MQFWIQKLNLFKDSILLMLKTMKRDKEYKLDYYQISMKRISCFIFLDSQTKQKLELKHSTSSFHFYNYFVDKNPGRTHIYGMLMLLQNNEVKR